MNNSERNISEILPFTSGLQCKGYWSGRDIVVNTSKQILWDSRVLPSEAATYLDETAHIAFHDYLMAMSRAALKHAIKKDANASVGYVLKGYGIQSKHLNKWAKSTGPLKQNKYANYGAAFRKLIDSTGDLELAATEIKNIYLPFIERQEYEGILTSEFSSRMDSPSSIIRIDWKTLLTGKDVGLGLTRVAKLATANVTSSNSGEKGIAEIIHQLGPLAKNISVSHDIFSISENRTKYANAMNILGLRKAAEWGLIALIRKGWLLMPLRWPSLSDSPILYGQAWWPELGAYLPWETHWSRRLFMRLICTTNAKSPADWSQELCLQYNPSTTGLLGSMIKGFNQAFQRYQLSNPSAPPFPVGEINNRRKQHRKTEDQREGSPGQLREKNLDDWAQAVELFYRLSHAVRNGKREAVKPLLDWAIIHGHTSPWNVQVNQLINPLHPDDANTFYKFLCGYKRKKSAWSGAVRFYTIACNALKPLPDYDKKGIRNPFEGLSNPFHERGNRRSTIGKTHRRLIPLDKLNAMLDTLLDCDDSGNPQYTWVKQKFRADFAERFNYRTGKFEVVWHPARARCLALLLIIPLRCKQARWLDQGLMDTHRWDVESDSWILNEHPLAAYQYSNGQLHSEFYGRPSGVLQPLDSLLGGNDSHLGLYINTNKTQLWNPESRTGYSVPWPDGKEMRASSDILVKERGLRLGRVYDLVKDQIEWMQIYDPATIPVTFSDDAEEYGPEVRSMLPAFCPIFRDLVSPTSRDDGKPVCVPVSKQKIDLLFHALAAETEDRLVKKGHDRASLGLTIQKRNTKIMINLGRSELLRRSTYDIHSLRVAGITHLLEMGIPAHIVSEFIAGHMALVMTLHYAKFQPMKLRQQLMDAFNEADTIRKFEDSLLNLGVSDQPLLITNPRFEDGDRPDPADVLLIKGTWRYINGGICPGASCEEGGIRIIESIRTTKRDAVPVPGGPESCGNCRFFLTSPSFIIPQMLAANSIMLQLRELGRHRKQLWDRKVGLDLAIFEGNASNRDRIEHMTLEAELERIERRLEPMILEWYNRFEMFKISTELLSTGDDSEPSESKRLMFLGVDDGTHVQAFLDSEGTDYSLVKEIVGQAEMLGGHRPISELAEHKLREFVDRVLSQESVPDLLLSMPEGSHRRQASLLLADAIEILSGKNLASGHTTPGQKMTPESRKTLKDMAARLTGHADDNKHVTPDHRHPLRYSPPDPEHGAGDEYL